MYLYCAEGGYRERGCLFGKYWIQVQQQKVLTFFIKKGVALKVLQDPNQTRFPDKFDNLCVSHVAIHDVMPR